MVAIIHRMCPVVNFVVFICRMEKRPLRLLSPSGKVPQVLDLSIFFVRPHRMQGGLRVTKYQSDLAPFLLCVWLPHNRNDPFRKETLLREIQQQGSSMESISMPPWQETLTYGHIVSFCMPHEKAGHERPKDRPCLVLNVFRRQTGPDLALLVYGTGEYSKFLSSSGATLLVDRKIDIAKASLRKPTLFAARRRILVPLDDPRFCCKDGSPIIGRLPRRFRDRLIQLKRRLMRDLLPKSPSQANMA